MVSEAQKKATTKYEHTNYDKVTLRIRSDGKDGYPSRQEMTDYAAGQGKTLNKFILDTVKKEMNN